MSRAGTSSVPAWVWGGAVGEQSSAGTVGFCWQNSIACMGVLALLGSWQSMAAVFVTEAQGSYPCHRRVFVSVPF